MFYPCEAATGGCGSVKPVGLEKTV